MKGIEGGLQRLTLHNQNDGFVTYVYKHRTSVTVQYSFGNVHRLSTNFTFGHNNYNILSFYTTHILDSFFTWTRRLLRKSKDVMCVFLADIDRDLTYK